MPLTEFQRIVLKIIKKHRNPNSYVAGGVAINRTNDSFRRSNDIDFFHDTDEAVFSAAQMDREILRQNGYDIQTLIEQPSFVRSIIYKGKETLKLEWVRDTAFRFFPVIEDEELGYRLHDVDLMVNKCLALANRSAVRDLIDLIQLDSRVLSFTAACFAACGKDPGFTPQLLLDCMRRHSIIRPEELLAENASLQFTAPELKKAWLELLEHAFMELDKFPVKDLGCIYLDVKGEVIRRPNVKEIFNYQRHFGKVGGSWPRVVVE